MRSLGSATFFTFGIVLVLLGANQAELARALAIDLAQTGFLGAVLALGLGVGVLIAGPLADRHAHRPLFVVSCLFTAASLLCIGRDCSYASMVLLISLTGLGCGLYETIVNTALVRRDPTGSAATLALVHCAATLGAGVGPLLIRYSLSHADWTLAFHALGYAHIGIAVWGLSKRGWEPGGGPRAQRAVSSMKALLASPALCALCVVAFAYVGVENGLTVFTVPWAETRGDPERIGQWSISAFWSGLLVGRLALAVHPPRRGPRLLAAIGLCAALIVCASSLLSLGPLMLVTALAGVVLGPVYPLMISLVAQRFPAQSGTAIGLLAGAGAAGGFAIPWLVGALGDAFGVRVAVTCLGAHACLIGVAALQHTKGMSR